MGALAIAFLFGAADQYLGSLSSHPLAVELSLLAAPWLLLPFLCGAATSGARRALIIGTLSVIAALLGYIAMTLSPIEGAHFTAAGVVSLAQWQVRWLALGLATAPFLAWIGN